jgi:hypothetical protein
MTEYEIDAKVKVHAASAHAAEAFVEELLSDETAINPAVEVLSIRAVGSVQHD